MKEVIGNRVVNCLKICRTLARLRCLDEYSSVGLLFACTFAGKRKVCFKINSADSTAGKRYGFEIH